MTDWEALRQDVPGTRSSTYLNSCSMGLPDQSTLDALGAYASSWSTRGAASWYDMWLDAQADWRRTMAGLLGARADELAWAPSVGAALGTLGSALLRRQLDGTAPARRDLVLGDLEFPAAYAALGQRHGITTRWAKSQGGSIPLRQYEALLGPTTETLLASRVLYSTGAVQDVQSLCQAARAAGAFSIVDDYQGLGQFTLRVDEVGADATVGGALKWMCGGVASAWMHVRRERIGELEPMHYGWWANAAMFDFRGDFTPWQDARRFEGGELNVPGLLTSLAAAKRFTRIGPQAIADRVQDLARDLRDRLDDRGVARMQMPSGMDSAIVALPRAEAAGDTARLEGEGIIVDHRHGMVRASPHYYNTHEENEKLAAALSSMSKSK